MIFVFGGFALRANSLRHLEKIDIYVPGHQVRFGNLNYSTDVHGDLIFDGFKPMSGAPDSPDEHDLDLPSDSIRVIAPAAAPGSNLEQTVPSEDGWMDPDMEEAHSSALEPNTPPTSYEVGTFGPSDSFPATGPEPRTPCLSNPIGHQSWSSPPRMFFSTRPWATC